MHLKNGKHQKLINTLKEIKWQADNVSLYTFLPAASIEAEKGKKKDIEFGYPFALGVW